MNRRIQLPLKRAFDILVSALLLFLFSPLFFLISLLIRLTMGQPIFFRQPRLGYQGRPFVIYKFRTMTDDRDEQGNLLSDQQRLTRLGRFLRSLTLDELPELINVLKGEMSLVGPRPLLVEYRDLYTPEQWRRHEMPPGMAGPVLAGGRNTLSWEEKFALDVWYVDHWSLWLDFQILARTALKVLISLGLIAYLFTRIDLAEVKEAVTSANYLYLALALALYFGAIALNVYKWGYLLRAQGLAVPFIGLLNHTFVGLFFANLPLSQVMGDIARGVDLARHTKGHGAEVAVSVLMDRLIGLASFLFASVVTLAFAVFSLGRADLTSLWVTVLVALLAFAVALAVLLSRWVARPLGRMAQAARALAAGEHRPIPVEGPAEVQTLARAFNEMSRQVEASQRSQREFVANVSHELKTPLTSVQGFAQAILDGTASDPDAVRQAAQVIYDEAARMHRLVLDLLDLARLDAGTADLLREPVDLAALARNVVQRMQPQAQAAQVALTVNGVDALVVYGDGDRLAQVLTNLLDNALKHTPPGGEVTVRVQEEAGWALCVVRDTGQGIPPEALPRIFERFYQLDQARRGGAGLGLSIAYEIVRAHGGTIAVQSEPGKGSVFVVKLPRVSSEDPTLIALQREKGTRL